MIDSFQKIPAKAKKSKSINKIEFDLRYLVMHTNNLAICMAAGFLGPRFEDGAVLDHNCKNEVLLLNSLPIPEHYLLDAVGDLNYGAVCIIELRMPKDLVSARILPFSYVERIIFSSQLEKDEFTAKLSGYSDVPDVGVPFVVNKGIFPVPGNALEVDIIKNGDCIVDRGFYCEVDKLSGVIFTLIFGLTGLKDLEKLKNFSKINEVNIPILNPIDFIEQINKSLELFSDSDDSFFLLKKTCKFLTSAEVKGGFDPKLFLDDLKNNGHNELTENQKKIVDGFCRHSLDVLELRRELTSLEDEAGKVIPRAILLFMLSPDSNKLVELLTSYPKLGKNVYLIASMLVGCFAGASTLPSCIKSFSSGSTLILPDFVFDLIRGAVGKFQFDSLFDEDGICKIKLIYKEKKILDLKSNPDEKSVLIFDVLRSKGQKVTFSKDGTLLVENSNELTTVKIKFELTNSFWSPSVLSVKASTTFPLRNFNKATLGFLVSETNPSERGVLLTVQPTGKSFVIELGMFSTLDNFTNSQAQFMCEEIFLKFQGILKKLN